LYTNAGHDPPYVRQADGSLQPLAERHGPLVGVAANAVYRESRCHLGPGDLLVVYTDGVTEAQDADGRFFSEERLAEVIRADGALSSNGVVDRILAAVESFEGGAERADDITVLAVQVLGAVDRETVIAETAVLRNQLSDLDTLDHILDRFGTHGRLPAATMAELRVVCDDIVSNVINHGFPQGGEHDIEVRLELTGRRLVVTVSDDGVAFNPLAVAPPDTTLPLEQRELGGLGIHLVRNLTDEATYSRHRGRNVITLVKMVPGPSPDPPDGSPREPLPPL
jgi:phosphoserine phosphatase RsbU/P